jgi:hypothetical protein
MRNAIMLLLLTEVSSVVLAGGVVNSARDPQVRVIQSGELVKVIYVNSEKTDVRISMMDEQGETIFTEKIRNQESFIRPYNLSNLEEGIYQIEIKHDDETLVGQIACVHEEPGSPAVASESEFIAHVSKIVKPDRKERYLLTVPHAGENEYTITIHNEADQLLYENTVHASGDFAQVYRIEDQAAGKVVIQVTSKDGKMMRFIPSREEIDAPAKIKE